MSEILYRECAIDIRASEDDGATIEFAASSETPVQRWGDSEILLHGEDNVRLDRLRGLGAFLVNHDPDQRGGSIQSAELRDGRLMVNVRFLSTAFGQQIKTEVAEGSLRGVSVGYKVHAWEYDEGKREARATDWEVYEVSATPIPADASVGIGRQETITKDQWQGAIGRTEKPAAPAAANASERNITMAEEQKPQEPAVDHSANEAQRAAEMAALREQAAAHERNAKILARANEHGIQVSEDELGKFRSVEDGCDFIMREMAKAKPEPIVTIGREHHEKQRDLILEAAEQKYGAEKGDNKLRNASILELGRRFLLAHGQEIPDDRRSLAKALLTRDAANVLSTDFTTYVLANTMTKVAMNGYGAARSTYEQWTVSRSVPDFKTFTGAALDRGNLQETAENVAFPELAKAEDGYSDTLKMWGVTLSLSMQAMINDDLGEFMRQIGQAGAIARRTIEKQVYTEVEDATWTSHTTATGAMGTDGNIAKGVAAFMNRSGDAGAKIDIDPSYLIVPVGLYEDALKLTTEVQGATEKIVNSFLTPIVTPHLTTAGTAANSTYYLAAAPSLADTLIVSMLEGVDSPIIEEYDAGAVAARKWKMMLPFETTLPAGLVGIHQCTQS